MFTPYLTIINIMVNGDLHNFSCKVSLLERKITQISLKLGNKIKTVVTNNLNYESTYPNTDAISCGPKLKK